MRLTAAIAAAILTATSTVAGSHTAGHHGELQKVSPGGSITLEAGLTSCEISTHGDKTWDKTVATTTDDSKVVLTIPSGLVCSGSIKDNQNICGFKCTGDGHTRFGAFQLEGAVTKRANNNKKSHKGKGKGKGKAKAKGKKKAKNPDADLTQLQGTPNEIAPPDVSADDTDTDSTATATATPTPEVQNKLKRAAAKKPAAKKKGGKKKAAKKKKPANPDAGLTKLQGVPNLMADPDVSADDTDTDAAATPTPVVQNKLLKRANKKKGKKKGKAGKKKKPANPDKGLTKLQGTPNEIAPPEVDSEPEETATATPTPEVQNKLVKRANKKKKKKGGKKKAKKPNPDKGLTQLQGTPNEIAPPEVDSEPEEAATATPTPEVQNKLVKRANKKKNKKGGKKKAKKPNPDKGLKQLQGTPNEIAPPEVDSEPEEAAAATPTPTPTPVVQNRLLRRADKKKKEGKKHGAKKGKKKAPNPDKGLTQLQGTPNEMPDPVVSSAAPAVASATATPETKLRFHRY
ncbi:hypothetical protein TWF694_006602 [Orbilia ellipsospora]|uniref:Uncharacterized protein n=1 Tax=Orbilia ellipsospora TaxID=2528407 RepID=A0AAV9XL16_9PEZI